MHFSRHGEFLSASRTTGPHHNRLELILSDASPQPPLFEFLPPAGECTHAPLDRDGIVAAVMEGIALANARLGSRYAVTTIRVPANDTPPEVVYGSLALAIVERLNAGEAFEPK